jgi:hypothetical protein
MRAALVILLLVPCLASAQWAIGPSYVEDVQTWYRIFDIHTSKTVGWANGWGMAVRMSSCTDLEIALRTLVAANPQLPAAALGVNALARIDNGVTIPAPYMSNDGAQIPGVDSLMDGNGNKWTLNGTMVLKNGVDTGGRATLLIFRSGVVYAFSTGVWWQWTGSWTKALNGYNPTLE